MYEDEIDLAFDYLEKAYNASTKEDAIKYAKKALEYNKDEFDAKIVIAKNSAKTYEDLENDLMILEVEEKIRLEKEEMFEKDNIGHFWGIIETRPYIRLLITIIKTKIKLGKYQEAISTCKEILRLNDGDNTGTRFVILALYAFLGDEDNALKIYNREDYFAFNSTSMLLCMIMLYYKLNNEKEALKYLKLLFEVNEDAQDFFIEYKKFKQEDFDKVLKKGAYRPSSFQEIIVTLDENSFLYKDNKGFMEFMIKNAKEYNN